MLLPANISQLHSFLGVLNCYGEFLPNLAIVLAPLLELFQTKRKWKWIREYECAFKEAEKLLASTNVLTHFDAPFPLLLAWDALPYRGMAILSDISSWYREDLLHKH